MSHRDNPDSHTPPDPKPEVPETPDRRSPQLDKVVNRSRCGCACVSSRAAGEGDSCDGGGGGGGGCGSVVIVIIEGGTDALYLPAAAISDTTSDAGDSVVGDEGVEEHLIDLEDMGYHTKQDLKNMLRRRNYCYCRPGVIPDLDDHPRLGFTSPAASGLTPRFAVDEFSVAAVHGGGSVAMTDSYTTASTASIRSQTPNDLCAYTGALFNSEEPFPPAPAGNPLVRNPLWLTHERAYTLNCVIGTDFRYQFDLDLEDYAQSGYDDDDEMM